LQLFERSEFCNAGEANAGKTEILTPTRRKASTEPGNTIRLDISEPGNGLSHIISENKSTFFFSDL
jgi:hypothetical protein